MTPGGGDAAAWYFQGYPNPENFQGEIQQSSEQPDQVEDDPALCKGIELNDP